MPSFQQQQKSQGIKITNRKARPIQREKHLQKLVPEKGLMAELLGKDIKTTVLKMLKELKKMWMK